MSDAPPDDCSIDANPAAVAAPANGENALPTLQRNVLRKYFRRAQFSVDDVAEIDYQRLVKFPGIGAKGIQNIRLWLHGFGLDLRNVPVPGEGSGGEGRVASGKTQRIARVIALLRKQGFVVRPSRVNTDSR